jgi:hypothetical protein
MRVTERKQASLDQGRVKTGHIAAMPRTRSDWFGQGFVLNRPKEGYSLQKSSFFYFFCMVKGAGSFTVHCTWRNPENNALSSLH